MEKMITPTQIKLIASALVLALLLYLSYDYGATSVREDWQAERISLDASTKKALLAQIDANNALNDSLAEAKAKSEQVRVVTKIETQEVEKEVVKYVTKYRDNQCVADDDWLRIYNRSIERTKATSASAK